MKKSLLSVLLMVLLTPWAIKADELTVCDGAAGSSYVPFYGMYADTQGAASECIIPSDSLSDMAGGQISAMKFYISSSAAAAWTGTHQVYVGEVDQTTMTTIGGPGLYTVVKTAVFDATGSELTITFDAPYAYAGGNLLIGTYVSAAGNWKSATFAGVAQTENTGAYRDGASGSATRVKFLPKTTFTYTPGAAPTCDKPATVAVSDITNNSATVAWTGNSAAFNVEYKKASDQAWTPVLGSTSLLTTSLSGLAPLTSYVVRVQGICGNDSSAWKSASFTTEAGVPLISDFSTGSIPTEWSRYSALLENVMKSSATLTPYTSGWGSGSANGVFGTEKHLKINIYGNSCNYWIVSPEIMMENNVQLSFDLALTKYSGTLSPVDKTQQDDDQFVVLITTDSGTSWQILRQWNNTGSPYVYNDITCSAAGEPVAIDLSSFSGQKIAIALYGESTVTGNGDNNLQADWSVEGTNCVLKSYDAEHQGFKLTLNEAAAAGQYVLVVENIGPKGSYIVLPSTENEAERTYGEDTIKYIFAGDGNDAWRFAVKFNDGGDFVKIVEDATPETPTETSDMTMVLFIVAAAAIVLVVLKKKAF